MKNSPAKQIYTHDLMRVLRSSLIYILPSLLVIAGPLQAYFSENYGILASMLVSVIFDTYSRYLADNTKG